MEILPDPALVPHPNSSEGELHAQGIQDQAQNDGDLNQGNRTS